MYIDSWTDDFTCFVSTETGFGNAGLKDGKPFLRAAYGEIVVKDFVVN
jgi:hypothetical protein